MQKEIMDGCTAATYIAYALSDVATIYPITPVASMGEMAQKWGMAGRKNYAGTTMRVEELESELGAAGATHGALAAGALATTFTNSQGLMLMISNMYKMAGNMVPAVFHVGTRSLATHALSIFGDHSDIMATRATGFAFLGSCTVQETMDLALVAHLAAVEGSLPVCHFFDGWRTSNQMATIDVIPYEQIFKLVDYDAISRFRARALNPETPTLRGWAQNSDVFFQNAEAVNTHYEVFPTIVQKQMDRIAKITGRSYHIFDYYGCDNPDVVLIAMGSSCEVIATTIDSLNNHGYKAGIVKVRLFRPFSAEALMNAIPATTKTVIVLDRTKENGADGEPLYKDVAVAAVQSGRTDLRILGGRYGLGSKDFSPAMVKAIIDEGLKQNPKRTFTIGITDDVTHLSLDYDTSFHLESPDITQAVFYGFGSDGMVGATKQAAHIISDAGNYVQAYFSYSAKKSGGETVSELRISPSPIIEEYSIEQADFVVCSKPQYVSRFKMAAKLKPKGTFLLNCPWTDQELSTKLPASMRRELAQKEAKLYVIDATKIAEDNGLGARVNMPMETAFFKLSNILPAAQAKEALKSSVKQAYMHEGGQVVNQNIAAIDVVDNALRQVVIPTEWADIAAGTSATATSFNQTDSLLSTADFFKDISQPCLNLEGNALPVSAFTPDGRIPMGTTAYEKRGIAVNVPKWDAEKCVECTECSLVCAHAAIRPFLLDTQETTAAPEGLSSKPASGSENIKNLNYRIQVYTMDCTGCSSCATICPGKALTMEPLQSQVTEQMPFEQYIEEHVSLKTDKVPRFTINGSQFQQPLLEFSGACAGCGETPYVKLLTQLFGERMIIANATGCSSIWGANYPSNAYCTRKKDGRGPAWGNSLFEDNAEYGYGMAVATRQQRETLRLKTLSIVNDPSTSPSLRDAANAWLNAFDLPEESDTCGQTLIATINQVAEEKRTQEMLYILNHSSMLAKKSIWAIGGDGWAYDIGFAGLDHVLASGEDINILVLDTECYSNTGGQTSKATPLGAVTKYSPNGKRVYKKDLGRMMMSYGTVYVASISLGANYQQTIDALREAESYPGPSIVIAYCPCINHGIRAGMGDSIVEERKAVEAGYWPIYRYNPLLAEQKLSPYIADNIATSRNIGANGLPNAGSPSAMETSDKTAAGEGPWVKVNDETRQLTIDYPISTTGQSGSTVISPTKDANDDAEVLFPIEKLNDFLDGEDRYADLSMVTTAAIAQLLRQDLSKRTRLLHTLLMSLSATLK